MKYCEGSMCAYGHAGGCEACSEKYKNVGYESAVATEDQMIDGVSVDLLKKARDSSINDDVRFEISKLIGDTNEK